MAKILAFSFFPAKLPPRSGGEWRLFALYEALSHHHEVVLLTSGELGGHELTLRHNPKFREVRVPKCKAFAEAWATLAGHSGSGDLSGPTLAQASATPNALHHAYLAHHADADVIIHDSPFTAGYDLFLGFDGKPRIYNSYNVEFDLYRQLHHDAETDAVAQIVKRWESLLIRHSVLVTGCTEDDLNRFEVLYGPMAATALVPNGVAPFDDRNTRRAGNKLIFIGSGHYPNQTAARIIRDELAPSLPEFEFHLVGNCLEPGRPRSNVLSHGVVDEATKTRLLGSAFASVNPMLEGGGSSLKIPDLIAHGVPLITTELGARGFTLSAGKHFSPIDVENLSVSVRAAIEQPERLSTQAEAAARHIRSNFTWPAIAQGFASRIDQLVAENGASSDFRLVAINDYDPFASVGGGNTRIKGLYEGASKHLRPLILTLTEEQTIVRRELFDGRGLAIAVPKTTSHREADARQAAEFHVSTADLLAMAMAPENPFLVALFDATASFTELVACEHPYMASLLLGSNRRFIYSSQNHELGLKRQLLSHHPRQAELLAELTEIEKFCVGCSELVIAVSDSDAAAFAAEHDLIAPIAVVSNGSEDPCQLPEPVPPLPGFNACFLGSGHMPNHLAARFLIQEVAPLLPDVTFHIAGSVCDGFEAAPPNVLLLGRLSDEEKTRLFLGCQLALNPVETGSGSNVKIADYLSHGLAVISTEFGARGYEGLSGDDLSIVPLDAFVRAIAARHADGHSCQQRDDRRQSLHGRFSMKAFGSHYGETIAKVRAPRARALFVTYRYNDPALGGGEHYANRLISYLANAGVAVDVLTPKVSKIDDQDRFGSVYPAESGPYPVPYGNPLIRTAKFDTASVPQRDLLLKAIWEQQPAFSRQLYKRLPPAQTESALTWGWTSGDGTGRWSLKQFGLFAAEAGRLEIRGNSPCAHFLVIRGAGGEVIQERAVEGDFHVECMVPQGLIEANLYDTGDNRPNDPRPLGLFVTELQIDGNPLLGSPPLDQLRDHGAPAVFNELHRAALETRFAAKTALTQVRGPYCPDLEQYLVDHVGDYNLVITHNAVFRTTSVAIAAAKAAKVPSIIVPHAHFEDDFYHFPDVMAAIADATRALVTPRAACDFLSSLGLTNISFLSPGIDGEEGFSDEDLEAFLTVYRRKQPFILVAGRKASAKGYRDVIAAVGALRNAGWPDLRVVLIGPDDDGLPVREDFVDYLGPVDRPVLRGAYRACLALANMSTSESFGIVLLEAGLAGRPVLANAHCAAFTELVVNGANGYLVHPQNLIDRLAAILADPEHAAALGKAGREMALQYDWARIGASFVSCCNALIGDKGA